MAVVKTPIVIFSTDWHIKEDNIDIIIDLVSQKCKLAKQLNVKYLVCLGDVFESRIAQKQSVLDAFSTIIEMVSNYGLKLVCIPGNHDKTNYGSKVSFLSPYKGRENFVLVDSKDLAVVEGVKLLFIPFFKDEVWLEVLDSFKGHYEGSILCTHIAVTGSRNNDGTMVSSTISTGMFKSFFKVFSGHYHDQQKIGEKFYHLPSIRQNNFGENSDKGFTVLYSDGSHELVKSNFIEFKKVKINLDELELSQLMILRDQYLNENSKVKFELLGSESQLKSINSDDFKGIQLSKKTKEIEDDIQYAESNEVVEMTASTIKEEFIKFCDQEKIDMSVGMKFLNKLNLF